MKSGDWGSKLKLALGEKTQQILLSYISVIVLTKLRIIKSALFLHKMEKRQTIGVARLNIEH